MAELISQYVNGFRVIIAGTRYFGDFAYLVKVCDYLLQNKKKVKIISGNARGADQLGEQYAHYRQYKLDTYPADWDRFGKSAGYRRNVEMAEHADALIAFWDGKSKVQVI
jgi:hypothetical protein